MPVTGLSVKLVDEKQLWQIGTLISQAVSLMMSVPHSCKIKWQFIWVTKYLQKTEVKNEFTLKCQYTLGIH